MTSRRVSSFESLYASGRRSENAGWANSLHLYFKSNYIKDIDGYTVPKE